jgi:uncharacterized membrane protein (DUF2068 family)
MVKAYDTRTADSAGHAKAAQGQSRLLPWLAAERGLRAVALIGAGLILVTHIHADWGELARGLAERAGLDPSRNITGRVTSGLLSFGPHQAERFGAIALGYGALEALEAYGLLRRRPWGEYLTVISTALLFAPEIQELLTRPTVLKAGGLVVNVVIVAYLVLRLVRRQSQGTRGRITPSLILGRAPARRRP